MRRVADFLVRNWPLKVGAIILASVLYSGLVLGQNIRTWTGTLPVEELRQPPGSTLIADLDPVTEVRYRAPLDVGVVSPNSFRATVDLSGVAATAGGPSSAVPITLIALDSRIQIVDFQPQMLQVQLDPVTTRTMPVTVDVGIVPGDLNLGPEQTDPSSVTITGASSRVDQVADVIARIQIDASALNVDRVVDLVAVDSNGNLVPNMKITPERTRVRIAVARVLANRSLPVVPQITGELAPGYRITSVSVDPLVVTVGGEAAAVSQMESGLTVPIDVSGRTSDLEAVVGFELPAGVSVVGSDLVRVVLTVGEITGSQTFPTGFELSGTQCECVYSFDKQPVFVTLSGPLLTLNAVDPNGCCVATLDITGLSPGSHAVALTVDAPQGLEVTAISPAEITVVIQAATPEPTQPPLVTPSPTATP